MDLLKKAINTIEKYSMLSQDDSVLIGLSGGADSVCLTLILYELKDNFNLSLHAVYIDHGLRTDEVERERAFCKGLCNRLGIKFFSRSVDVKKVAKERRLGLQEAARWLRYRVFEELSIEIHVTKIALGHNADDQAETVLMRLLRGAGSRGLSGIPPVRGKIIRPLIEIERREIEEYLTSGISVPQFPELSSMPFMIDSSNLRTDYLRNWLRLRIVPELKRRYPSLVYSVGRTTEILRDEDAYLERIAERSLTEAMERKADRSVELSLSLLKGMEKPILRRVIRMAVKEIKGAGGIDFIHVEDIIGLVRDGRSGDSFNLPGGIRAVKGYSTLLLTTEVPSGLKTRILDVPGRLFIEEGGITLETEIVKDFEGVCNGRDTAVFDYATLGLPLYVRSRRRGDYFYPAGFGRRKKLQDFFVDNKIPRDQRDMIPLVVSGDDIVWVVGYRMDERFMAKEGTEQFLVVKLKRHYDIIDSFKNP